MIRREMQPVSVITFKTGTDEYGQPRMNGIDSTRTVDMYIKVYFQTPVDDVRYVDVTDVGLTTDHSITDSNIIEDASQNRYQILYIVPTHRYTQLLMKKL